MIETSRPRTVVGDAAIVQEVLFNGRLPGNYFEGCDDPRVRAVAGKVFLALSAHASYVPLGGIAAWGLSR